MIWNTTSAKQTHREMLAKHIDPVLGEIGLVRRPASTKYKRTLPGATQSVDIFVKMIHGVVHIISHLSIEMPAVDAVAQALARGNVISKDSVTIVSPSGWVGDEHQYTDWPTRNADEHDRAGALLSQFLRAYAFPFLEEYTDHRGIIQNGLSDRRHSTPEHFGVVVAAAYLLEGQRNVARALIEARYGNALGLRRRFQSAFDYFDN